MLAGMQRIRKWSCLCCDCLEGTAVNPSRDLMGSRLPVDWLAGGGASPVGRRPGRGFYHTPPPGTEVKN
jgi:hypothetical protein